MSLLLIRSTLRAGWRIGLAIGAGVALVDGVYAACGAAGVAPLIGLSPVRIVLGLAGAAFLGVVGVRTLYSATRVRLGAEVPSDLATAGRAFRTSLAGTASNPATIASWAAIFAAASTAGAATTTEAAALLILGVSIGSLAWVTALAIGVAMIRRGLGTRALRIADGVAGLGMLGSAGALAYSTVHDR
jgi:putative LysE/RhtB family amino acid efflux pump